MRFLPLSDDERERDITWFFDLALWLKIANGALEILAGLLVLFVPRNLVLQLAEFATNGELSQDSGDVVASSLVSMAHSFAVHTHYLLAVYLLLHGGIKVMLVIGIFKKKRIAYPLFVGALIVFGGYEAYRGFLLHETLLQFIAVLDLILLILTVHEYRRRYPGHTFWQGIRAGAAEALPD